MAICVPDATIPSTQNVNLTRPYRPMLKGETPV